MFGFDEVLGSWAVLVHRLEARGTWAVWCAAEPALRVASGPGEAPGLLAAGGNPATADAVLGSLVRLAAADGGDDSDAVLVLLHLLAPGISTLARLIGHRTRDSLAVAAGELTCQIRRFPWRRRSRAYAANLVLDTKHALWVGEFRPLPDPAHPDAAVLFDPTASEVWDRSSAAPSEDPTGIGDLDVGHLLSWAAARGVAPVEDLALLWESQQALSAGASRTETAAARGLGERRDRRRRHKTLSALRDCRHEYLATVA